QRRDWVTGQLQRDEYSRNGVRNDQYHVLSHLGVGNTFHTTQYGVNQYHAGGNPDTGGAAYFQEAGEGYTGTGHLTDYVGNRRHDQTDNSDQTRTAAVETVTDKVGHGKLTELTQVRSQQHGQQHVTTGPAHQEGRVNVTYRQQTRHGDKRCS